MIGIAKTMYCFVKLPNSVVLDVDVDPKADAQECLHKVLDHLNIIESDYFGLQYTTKDGCPTWLNLRNPIDQQLGLAGPAPYRLNLRVKFFVQPHRLLQAATRHQFYLNVRQDLRDGRLRLLTAAPHLVAVAAHIAQAEYGDHAPLAPLAPGHLYTHLLPDRRGGDAEDEVVAAVEEAHAALRGMPPPAAEYRALQAAAACNGYGMEYFTVALEPNTVNELYGNKRVKGQGQHIMGVGPEGVFLYNAKWKQKRMFAYPSVHRITSCTRCFSLVVFRDAAPPAPAPGSSPSSATTAGGECTLDVRLSTRAAAGALYRCVTEMYCFYLCETVRDNVVTQFSRDLKGTLASLFNENSTVGKKYTFDIQRTANEAYDFYRRTMYKAGLTEGPAAGSPGSPETAMMTSTTTNPNFSSSSSSSAGGDCCSALREQVSALQDAVLCVLCVDAPLAVLFAPCRHVVCCRACARRVDTCPVCRTRIDDRQPIYMPGVPTSPQGTGSVSQQQQQQQQAVEESSSSPQQHHRAVLISHL